MCVPETDETMQRIVYIVSTQVGLRQCVEHRVASLVNFDVEVREVIPPPSTDESQSFTSNQIDELSKAEILLADPKLVRPILHKLKNLKWFQSTWAGVDSIIKPSGPRPTFILSRMGDIFGPVIAEYTIAQIISHERLFHRYWQQQKDRIWQQHHVTRSLQDLTLGIIGVGNIGCKVAEVAKNLGMTTWGLVRRDLPPNQRTPHIDFYRKQDDLPELLSESDYICNLLPGTEKTKNFLSGDILKYCQRKKSVFINVGRSEVIDDESLLTAIKNDWIAAAVLDVFHQEPLPKNHPFWTTPQIVITPHVSGPGITSEMTKFFLRNLKLYASNEPVEFKFDWNQGY